MRASVVDARVQDARADARSTGAAFAIALAVALAPSVSGCDSGTPELASAPFRIGAPRYHVDVSGDGRSIVFRRDAEALLVLPADGFQVGVVDALDDAASYDPFALDGRENDAGVTYRAAVSFRSTANGAADGSVDLDFGDGLTAHLEIRDAGDDSFTFDFVADTGPVDGPVMALVRMRAQTSGDPTEGFYGLGEWEDSVDHRGRLRAMQVEPDLEIESANNEAHVPMPFLIGTHGWAIFVESRRVGAFDVARKDPGAVEATFAIASRHGKDTPPDPVRIWFFGADAPLDLVRGCYRVTGKAKVPPAWALGPWIWRDENKDQKEIEDDIRAMRELDLATSGIWIDHPYATAVETFDYDKKKFTDPQALIQKVHGAGLRLAVWSTPYLEPAAEPFRSEAVTKRFFPLQNGIPLNPWSSPIDLTNAEAFTFWSGLATRYTSMGIEGFKLDYAEDVAPSLGLVRNVWRFADGSDERTMHHGYSGLYHRAYADALPDDRFLLCRAAHWGEQPIGCIIWPGDMDASFTQHRERFTPRDGKEVVGVGGLPATVIMGLSLGASGFPFFGADTGGYRHSPPDEELWLRWVEQTSLSSVMQVGDSSSQPPWVFTPENGRSKSSVDVYRTYARLHMQLFPYEWTYAQHIDVDGRPIQRPIGLAFPELGIHPSDSYMFGDDLLVAPVLVRGQRVRNVVAPAGTWIDWWDGTSYSSDGRIPISIDAPLGKLPLLIRDGGIVPMLRPTIDTLATADDASIESFARDPGQLWVRIAPGRPRRFELWDSSSIERGPEGAIRVVSGSVFTTGFVLESLVTPEPRDVSREDDAGSRALERRASLDVLTASPDGWAWDAAKRGTLWIKVGAGATRVVIR
jgi:alpha-D-xyloside xylohydrolase